MINTEENKKLLAQIAELEKNSVNYFDVEKEFFLIDSDNLPQARPQVDDLMYRQDLHSMNIDSNNSPQMRSRLYGYSIQSTGIYEDDDLTPEVVAGLDGRGCYVYVEVKDGKITIKQDLNGSWGLYLFRHGDYFALSNSFFRLVDHVKVKYPLTVNRDYCHHQVTDNLCSISYSETAVNEIQLVDRRAILQIDIAKKTLNIELIDYKEYTVPLDSEKGIATFDNWVEFWGNLLRNVTNQTKFFTADLSGGFDTRISLALLLNSGIDLNEIQVYSTKGTDHTFPEDYAIATDIANHYDFKLNQPHPPNEYVNRSCFDVFNINLYVLQLFSNIPRFDFRKPVNKHYSFSGSSGETLRSYWQMLPEELKSMYRRNAASFSPNLSRELSHSIDNILESTFKGIRDNYKITNKDSKKIPRLVYREARNRSHFGKHFLADYLACNRVRFSPALDPKVITLRLDTTECADQNLLMSLLFVRYAPDLLKFPFDLNRSIAPETIAYAQKLNERFPLRPKNENNMGGCNFIYGRVTHKQKRLSPRVRKTPIFLPVCCNVA